MTNSHESTTIEQAQDVSAPDSMSAASRPTRKRQKRALEAATIVGLAYLLLVVVVAVLAPILWPHIATQQAGNILEANQLPSFDHLLGTDTVGRDVFLRLLVGTRPTMIGVLEGLFFALIFGIPVGVAAGYFGGWLDKLVSWLADIVFSIPGILVIIIVLAVFPANMTAAMFTYGILAAPGLMRLVRSVTLQVREELFVQAALVAGLSSFYILSRHVLSRIRGAVAVQASLLAAGALLVQTGLAFLGLLVTPPTPSWGGMVADGTNVLAQNGWLIWPAGIVIAMTVLAFGIIGDSIQTKTGSRNKRVKIPHITSKKQNNTHLSGSAEKTVNSSDVLRVTDLCVSSATSEGIIPIVNSVTLRIGRSEVVGLVGESGCGKSVTSSAFLGLLQGSLFVSGGTVMFGDRDLNTLSEGELRHIRGKRIGFIGQEPMISLNPVMRIGNQLEELVRLHHGCGRAEARNIVRKLLISVRMPDPDSVMRSYPHELSGGMAQRVSIARALSGKPDLLIADEPTTALDVTVQAEILDLLRELQQRNNMSVIVITHDWGVVADVCDRTYVMYAGHIVEERTIHDIFAQPAHPYTSLLLSSDPHRSRGSDVLPTISGQVPPPGTWPLGCRFADRCPFVQEDCRVGPVAITPYGRSGQVRCIHPLEGPQK